MKNLFFLFISLVTTTIAVAQNVGIGTTDPQAKLDVNGTFRVTDGTQGAGKILTSDAEDWLVGNCLLQLIPIQIRHRRIIR